MLDVYDLPERGLEPFDIVLHHGLFYHLPDPIQGLKVAADLTKDLLVLNTATRSGLPDGLLTVGSESTVQVLSGVYGLNWFPTGPDVLVAMLRWMGFVDFHLRWWQKETETPNMGRLELLASKLPDGLRNARR